MDQKKFISLLVSSCIFNLAQASNCLDSSLYSEISQYKNIRIYLCDNAQDASPVECLKKSYFIPDLQNNLKNRLILCKGAINTKVSLDCFKQTYNLPELQNSPKYRAALCQKVKSLKTIECFKQSYFDPEISSNIMERINHCYAR